MLKKIFTLFFSLFSIVVLSQERQANPLESEQCGHSEALHWLQTNYPEEFIIYQQANDLLKTQTEESNLGLIEGGVPKSTIYTVPIVFHVLHHGGQENISLEQIESAVDYLNLTFRKLNDEVNEVYPLFQSIVGDAKIKFELATIAPNGRCFDGITRTYSLETFGEDPLDQLEAIILHNDVYQDIWPHTQYLNVIVANNLIPGAAGFTNYPYSDDEIDFFNMYLNAIYIRHTYVGLIGTGSELTSKTLSHEAGHWLNLMHVWGDSNEPGLASNCNIDDEVLDTPNTIGGSGCDLTRSTCDGTIDNVENFMEYSSCRKMFTEGQVARMRTALTSPIGSRNMLWTNTNLVNTGINPGGNSWCANFSAANEYLCLNNSTTFSVTSDEPILSYAWTFSGGIPFSSTSPNPSVTYNSTGIYNVSVTITTTSRQVTLHRNGYISVGTPAILQSELPISEGFVSPIFPPTNWEIINSGNQDITWERNNTHGNSPTNGNSVMMDNFSTYTTGDRDDLVLPTFSLFGYESAILEFDVAYSPYTEGFEDELQVLVYTGCSNSPYYDTIYLKKGYNLETEPFYMSAYTNPQVWRKETISLAPYLDLPDVQIRFRCVSGWGNYLYLDNINVSGTINPNTEELIPTPNMQVNTNQICEGENVQFTDLSTQNPTSWHWTFVGGNPVTSTLQNPTITYDIPGIYNVTLQVENAYGAASELFTNAIAVYPNPAIPSIIQNQNNLFVNLISGETAEWMLNNTIIGEGEGIEITENGNYVVTVTNTVGCQSSTQGYFNVSGTGLTDEFSSIQVRIHPNPSQGNIRISSNLPIEKVILYDNLGRMIYFNEDFQSIDFDLNLSRISSGTYFIQLISGENTKFEKLILVD